MYRPISTDKAIYNTQHTKLMHCDSPAVKNTKNPAERGRPKASFARLIKIPARSTLLYGMAWVGNLDNLQKKKARRSTVQSGARARITVQTITQTTAKTT
jgi:hypothetical protein